MSRVGRLRSCGVEGIRNISKLHIRIDARIAIQLGATLASTIRQTGGGGGGPRKGGDAIHHEETTCARPAPDNEHTCALYIRLQDGRRSQQDPEAEKEKTARAKVNGIFLLTDTWVNSCKRAYDLQNGEK